MKTFKHLYPKVCDFDNLYLAWRQARKGKRYKTSSATFEQDLDRNLLSLFEELQSEIWQPGGYRSFTIHEPKRRKISAAPFRDRVVHHALVNVLEPLYERKFIADSFANQVGKGTHRALDRCTAFMRRFKYGSEFFPSSATASLNPRLTYLEFFQFDKHSDEAKGIIALDLRRLP